MPRPRLLDLFCGAGGAAMGYDRAGFDVVGVDNRPMPHYPFEFHQADALTYPLDGFDAVHASPPCHDYTSLRPAPDGTGWMLAATHARLVAAGLPWVIENVPPARTAMPGAVTICARAVGRPRLRRHRLFLISFPILVPPCACDSTPAVGVYGDLRPADRTNGADGRRPRAGIQTARDLLDCQWMDAIELRQAIPPAMTEHVGSFLLDHLTAERGAA